MEKMFFEGRLKKVGEEIEFIASDETLDRMGEVVPIDSWDLTNFRKSPRLLIDHDYSVGSIVGKAENIRVVEGKLMFRPKFHDITEAARMAKGLVEEGFLDTVSVGFLPHAPKKNGDRITNELLEISLVSIPANPNARMNTLSIKSLEEAKAKVTDQDIKSIEWFISETVKEGFEKKEVEIVDFSDHKFILEKLGIDLDNKVLIFSVFVTLGQYLSTLEKGIDSLNEAFGVLLKMENDKSEIKGRNVRSQNQLLEKALVRALQDINRRTNDILRLNKKINESDES